MKIKRSSLPDEIADQIKAAIKEGEWKPGDKLPSENELAESFGVNRLTVRMALQKLNAHGILQTKVGEGSYVRDFSFSAYIDEVSDFYMTPEMINNVGEYRKALEIECARLAMERADAAEIAGLGGHCDRYDAVCARLFAQPDLDPDILEELIAKDLEFHREIVRLSKNTLYKYSFEVAREPILRYLHLILIHRIDTTANKRNLLERACAQHRTIYEAIRDKDFGTCREAYLKMIDYTAEL